MMIIDTIYNDFIIAKLTTVMVIGTKQAKHHFLAFATFSISL